MTGEEEPTSNLRHLEQPQCEFRAISQVGKLAVMKIWRKPSKDPSYRDTSMSFCWQSRSFSGLNRVQDSSVFPRALCGSLNGILEMTVLFEQRRLACSC